MSNIVAWHLKIRQSTLLLRSFNQKIYVLKSSVEALDHNFTPYIGDILIQVKRSIFNLTYISASLTLSSSSFSYKIGSCCPSNIPRVVPDFFTDICTETSNEKSLKLLLHGIISVSCPSTIDNSLQSAVKTTTCRKKWFESFTEEFSFYFQLFSKT